MARLRQIHPGNYRSSDRVNDEIEQIIRYVNAAELGNRTVAELLRILFDTDGKFRGPVEMRLHQTLGLQYRVGTYTSPEEGWLSLAALTDLRGPPGRDFGQIAGPLLYGRQDLTISSGQTAFTFFHTASDDILAFKNGVLQDDSLYVHSVGSGTVTFLTSPYSAPGDKLTLFRVRRDLVEAYRRVDFTASASQAVFPFSHLTTEVIQVYRNGVLQRPGGSYDYVNDPAASTVTFMEPLQAGDLVTIITVEDHSSAFVAGLMTEDRYTDGNGLIPWERLTVDNGDIPPAKVSGLATLLQGLFPTHVGASPPSGAVAGWEWIDTSVTPNILKFFDGVSWLRTSPATAVPDYSVVNALQTLRVMANGAGLEWSTIDLSSRVHVNLLGAANGVATLGSDGALPASQLPDIFALESYQLKMAGSVTGGTYEVRRIFKQKVRIDAISRKLGAGSLDMKITVDGTEVGSLYATTTSLAENSLTASIEVDATATSKSIGVKLSNVTSASDLDVVLAVAAVAV